jgi:hypothetical protein
VTICIVDTSAFCNVLDIPGKNQQRDTARAQFRDLIQADASLLLPLAAVYETGRHIGQLPDGGRRRRVAERFVEQVRLAVRGEAPWTPTPLPSFQDLDDWLAEFPDAGMRGLSLADLSIVKLWEIECARHPARRVLIWTYDSADLGGYDRLPSA